MKGELEGITDPKAAEVIALQDRLGPMERFRVKWDSSRNAGRALTRVDQHQIATEEKVANFAIDIAAEKMIGTMSANAVIAAGVIEARLNANAGAAVEALDQVVMARCVSSIDSRNGTLAEVEGLLKSGAISTAEHDELAALAARQHKKRVEGALERGDVSHARMKQIVAGSLQGER